MSLSRILAVVLFSFLSRISPRSLSSLFKVGSCLDASRAVRLGVGVAHQPSSYTVKVMAREMVVVEVVEVIVKAEVDN